jgi:Zn-dependent peptidase ImmA (M78 family)
VSSIRPGYARLRRRADELLIGLSKPPVDLSAIAQRLGVEIRLFELGAEVSGILYRDGDRKVVVVNNKHSNVRQRFTIAHELGHLILHKGEPVHVDEGFRVNLRDPRSATAEEVEEIEANAFAANLLMPSTWLKRDIDSDQLDPGDEEQLGKLAARYGVSLHAMALRLASLSQSTS